jgi:hypothetical protein
MPELLFVWWTIVVIHFTSGLNLKCCRVFWHDLLVQFHNLLNKSTYCDQPSTIRQVFNSNYLAMNRQ